MRLDYQALQDRWIDNDVFVHSQLAEKMRQLLSFNLSELPQQWKRNPNQWLIEDLDTRQTIQLDRLEGFTGILDLETTGLTYRDSVLCAVGIGYWQGKKVIVGHGAVDRLPIYESLVVNYNQPFDRGFYDIINGRDTNQHADLMSLVKITYASANPSDFGYASESLASSYQFLCGKKLDKGVRDAIISKDLDINRDGDAEAIVDYCFQDSVATFELFQNVLPKYVANNPSPISLYGSMLRSFSIPMGDIESYKSKMNEWYDSKLLEINQYLGQAAITFILATEDNPSYDSLLNISKTAYKTHKGLLRGIKDLEDSPLKQIIIEQSELNNPRARLEPVLDILRGEATLTKRYIPLIGGVTYRGYPIQLVGKKWMAGDIEMKNIDNPKAGLATPICKTYIKELKEWNPDNPIVLLARGIQFWTDFRGRLENIGTDKYGYYHPAYSPIGTLTGRSVDRGITLLCPSPKPDVGGTELYRLIQAKPGYKLVMADLDSAELIYASHVANYYLGNKSQTDNEFSVAILEGNSEEKTDIHSLVQSMLGLATRTLAKNIVYGSLYFEGVSSRINNLIASLQCSYEEAKKLADEFMDKFIKGKAEPYFEGLKRLTVDSYPTLLLSAFLPLGLGQVKYKESNGMLELDMDYFTTRINRNIQALGSDHLSMLLTDIHRCIQIEQLDATLILTRHDELIYHVAEKDVERFSQLMQESHMFAVGCLLARIGIEEAVDRWMRFSSVDIAQQYKDNRVITPTSHLTEPSYGTIS